MTLRKAFRLNDRVTADLRWESFNTFNTINWANPNTTFGSQNVGIISGTSGAPRQNQFAVKLNW